MGFTFPYVPAFVIGSSFLFRRSVELMKIKEDAETITMVVKSAKSDKDKSESVFLPIRVV